MVYSEQFMAELGWAFGKIKEWLSAHDDKIVRAFLVTRPHSLLLLVVCAEARYDAQFQDELTDLDLAIAHSYRTVSFSVLAIPPASPEGISGFLSDGALEIHVGAGAFRVE